LVDDPPLKVPRRGDPAGGWRLRCGWAVNVPRRGVAALATLFRPESHPAALFRPESHPKAALRWEFVLNVPRRGAAAPT
jgi:hypothetical protein